jgi:hypothetical protein
MPEGIQEGGQDGEIMTTSDFYAKPEASCSTSM